MTPPLELTFDAVDDLVGAYSRGRLGQPRSDARFVPRNLGPLIELTFHASARRFAAMGATPWLDQTAQSDLRAALSGTNISWFDGSRRRGLLRTIINPLDADHDLVRTGFLLAGRQAAEAVGFPVPIAQSLSAAIREMESNIHEHSERPRTGILAYQALDSGFEFVIADAGIGVLASLQQAPEFKNLSDHGRALHTALQEGPSRFGRAANRGMGFKSLFLGLASLNANLRFRSGDHALTIGGPSPNLKTAQLAQKPPYQGFLVSVYCELPPASRATH